MNLPLRWKDRMKANLAYLENWPILKDLRQNLKIWFSKYSYHIHIQVKFPERKVKKKNRWLIDRLKAGEKTLLQISVPARPKISPIRFKLFYPHFPLMSKLDKTSMYVWMWMNRYRIRFWFSWKYFRLMLILYLFDTYKKKTRTRDYSI